MSDSRAERAHHQIDPGFSGMRYCDRCGGEIDGYVRLDASTQGFYDVAPGDTWTRYARWGEREVCDCCMWCDPYYVVTHGVVQHNVRPENVCRVADELRAVLARLEAALCQVGTKPSDPIPTPSLSGRRRGGEVRADGPRNRTGDSEPGPPKNPDKVHGDV